MAERRMFAKTIIDSDAFLEMPISSQCLYFHLSMRADDEGFINKPKTIMRMIGAKDDDMNVLIARKFIIPFESGVVVIKHWKIHNYIRGDRIHSTKYTDEKALLVQDENNAYTLLTDTCPPDASQLTATCHTEVRLGKVRLGKDSKEEELLSPFSPEMRAALMRWLQYKAERKETYKPTGLTAFISGVKNKLKLYPEAAVIDLIEACMANGWKGIIWDKLEGGLNQNGGTGKSIAGTPDKPRSTYQCPTRL